MSPPERPIDKTLPGLTSSLTPVSLADLPTPVQPLDGLGNHLGRDDLWIKRDDQSSALYAGNKVRKLEFLLGQARARGATRLLTMGGTGSNHVLATTLHGRSLGLSTCAVVFDQPQTPAVERTHAAHLGAGAELVRAGSKYLLPLRVATTLRRLRRQYPGRVALIPGGGSSPTGTLGFVNAGLELAVQVAEGALPCPREVFVPYGTGGTAVGLALGLQLSGLPCRVVAVRVIDRLLANRPRMLALAHATWRLMRRLAPDACQSSHAPGFNLEIRHGFIGTGYGHPTAEAVAAVQKFNRHDRVGLEFTYTGKAAAAFLEAAQLAPGPLLFWNTYNSADISGWVNDGQEMGK